MNTYEMRRERRRQRLMDLALRLESKGNARYQRARALADVIPLQKPYPGRTPQRGEGPAVSGQDPPEFFAGIRGTESFRGCSAAGGRGRLGWDLFG